MFEEEAAAMNARPINHLNAMFDRLFDALGYERKKPPQLTRIIIIRTPEPPDYAPSRAPQTRVIPARRYHY